MPNFFRRCGAEVGRDLLALSASRFCVGGLVGYAIIPSRTSSNWLATAWQHLYLPIALHLVIMTVFAILALTSIFTAFLGIYYSIKYIRGGKVISSLAMRLILRYQLALETSIGILYSLVVGSTLVVAIHEWLYLFLYLAFNFLFPAAVLFMYKILTSDLMLAFKNAPLQSDGGDGGSELPCSSVSKGAIRVDHGGGGNPKMGFRENRSPSMGQTPEDRATNFYPTPVRRHRGGVILTLGILGVSMFPGFGIIALILGNKELREIRSGVADPSGWQLVSAGRLLGIVSVFLMAIFLLVITVVAMFAGDS